MLGVLLALGSVAFAPAKAYAATDGVRTAFSLGADISGPLVASGSNIVFGTHRSTDTGANWARDTSLVPVRASSWASYANDQMLGLTDSTTNGVVTRSAVVYTVSSGASQSYVLPSDVSSMGGSWMLPYGGGLTAYNFVTKASVTAVAPSGTLLMSGPYAILSPSGAVLWSAQAVDNKSLFAVSASPAAAPSAWTTIDGLAGGFWADNWFASATQLQYVLDTGTAIQFCQKPLSNLAAAATCVTAWSGSSADYSTTDATLYDFGSSTVVEVTRYAKTANEVRDYLWNGSTAVPLQVPSGSVLWMPTGAGQQYGDTPYAMVRDSSNGTPSAKKVNADGSLGGLITLPTSPLRPDYLAVAPDRMVGGDNRDGSNVGASNINIWDRYTVWSRTVTGTVVGGESVLPRRASLFWAVAGRTAVSGRDGLSMYDRGTLAYTFADSTLTSMSGPYIEQTGYDATTGAPHTLVSTADGTQVATFASEGALFGSTYVTYSSSYTNVMHAVVNDLTGKTPARALDLSVGNAACSGFQVWYGFVGMTCYDFDVHADIAKVFNLQTGALVKSDAGGWLENLNDGFITVGSYDSVSSLNVYRVESFAGGAPVALNDCIDGVQNDGVGQLVCSSNTEMIWRDYSSLSTSAGRVLGWLAPTTFASGTWTPQIDATKPFSAGVLRISQGATVVRELTVPASADGSVRGVSWDGKNTAGVTAPSGTYTATLVVSGKDSSGAVKAIDGVSAPTLDVAWTGGTVVTGTPGSFVALTPYRLLDTRVGSGGTGPLPAAGSVDLQVTGRGGVPADGVGAVILNVTAVTPTAPGYLTVFPTGTIAPNASNLNFTAGQVVPNLVLAKVGTNGKVSIRNGSGGATEVIADVAGYFVSGTVVDPGGVTSVAPWRLLDTRVELGGPGPVAAGGTVKVQVTGRGGVPASGVSAVVVNLTAVTPTGAGFLTAFPSGGTVPLASNVNFVPGQVVPNLAFVKLGTDGSFTVRNGSSGVTEVIADVAGYVMDGKVTGSGMFVALTPSRILDTRDSSAVGASSVRTLTVAGAGGVPATGISGAVLNVTVVAGGSPGYLTVYPADVSAPLASNLNFTPGQVVPNLVAVKTSAAGAVAIRNASGTPIQVIADVAGYFTA
jgi:FlgD Ig-like domain